MRISRVRQGVLRNPEEGGREEKREGEREERKEGGGERETVLIG